MSRPPPSIDVAIALIQREGRYLVAQRGPGSHLAGAWEFPGGKREAGEAWEACLRRELREELGIEATVGELVESFGFDYPERAVQIRVFACELTGGEPEGQDGQPVRWMTAEELARARYPAANKPLIDRLLKMNHGLR